MKFSLFLSALFCFQFASFAFAKFTFLGKVDVPHKLQIKNAVVGGLSGLLCVPEENKIFAVSDDRGENGEPRIIEFKFEVQENSQDTTGVKVKFEPVGVIFIKDKNKKTSIWDFEGITTLPWGNFLLSSEGDGNHKPRIPPAIFDVKKDGTIVRQFPIPRHFLPESSGKQKRGAQNNRGFESLTRSPDGTSFFLANETPLVQDLDSGMIRILQLGMPEAWVIKPLKEYAYRLGSPGQKDMASGVSEMLAVDSDKLLVMERGISLGGSMGMQFDVKLYETSLKDGQDIIKYSRLKKTSPELKKNLVFDFASLVESKQVDMIQNFEGMCFGPDLKNGHKTLIFVSDDNFKSILKTQFLVLQWGSE